MPNFRSLPMRATARDRRTGTPEPMPILGPLDGPTYGRRSTDRPQARAFAHAQSGVTGHLGGPEWRSYTGRTDTNRGI